MIEQNNLIPNYAVYMQDIMFIEIRDLKRGEGFVPPIVPPPMNQSILVYLTERLKFPTHLNQFYG